MKKVTSILSLAVVFVGVQVAPAFAQETKLEQIEKKAEKAEVKAQQRVLKAEAQAGKTRVKAVKKSQKLH